MDGYVTRQSPTWRNWFAYKLGFTDLPTRVNCWYCNQTSYLLPGSKQTVRHWYCRLCENTNAIDQYGDIMDAPPIPETSSTSAYGSSLKQRKKYQQSRSSSTTMPTKDQRTLCENCQRNQILIYQFMSEYLRDENDADYDYRVQHAREYQESLNNKHPLCAECQDKLQDVLAEQRDSLRRLKINEKRQLSMQSKIPTRISLSQYRWYASFWLILHSSVLFLCIFAVFYPPQPINHNETLTSIQDALKLLYYCFLYPFQQNEQDHTIISLSSSLPRAPSISSQIEWLFSRDAVIKFFWFTVNNLNSMMRFICYATYQLFSFVMVSSHSTIDSTILFDEDIESVKISSWDVTDIGIFCYIVFYTMSFPYMYWHIKVSRLFFKPSNLLGWQVYKVVQQCLYFSRFALLFSLAYGNSTKMIQFWIIFGCTYFTVLIWSVLFLKVKKSPNVDQWPGRIVGKSGKASSASQQQTTPNEQRSSFMHPWSSFSSPSSQYKQSISHTPQYSKHQSNGPVKHAWYSTPFHLFSHQEDKQTEQSDVEVDGLTADLGRISV